MTSDLADMGGKPCIRGMRVTVDDVVGLPDSGASREETHRSYPYLEDEDLTWSIRDKRRSQK